MFELDEHDKAALKKSLDEYRRDLEKQMPVSGSGITIHDNVINVSTKDIVGCGLNYLRSHLQSLADCLTKEALATIGPEDKEVDFCEDCREYKKSMEKWEKECQALAERKWGLNELRFGPCLEPEETMHICPNVVYKSGMLHGIIKEVVMKILSNIRIEKSYEKMQYVAEEPGGGCNVVSCYAICPNTDPK